MIEQKPLLQIAELPDVKPMELEPQPPNLDAMLTTAGPMGDRQYVLNNARADDYSRWREEIEERKKKEPKIIFLRCSKCGYRIKTAFQERLKKGPVFCLQCNRSGDEKGGFLKEMSNGEIKEWEKDRAADNVRRAEYFSKLKEAKRVAAMVDMAKQDRTR